MEAAKRIEDSLQEQISYLKNLKDKSAIFRSASDEAGTLKIIKEALQLARNYHVLRHFSRCVSLVEDIIEIYISHGREAKKQLIYSSVEIFVDEVISEKTSVFCKMEISRVLTILLEGCSLKVAQELLKRGKLNTKIKNLFSEIWLSGDFEMQAMLIASLLRLLPQKTYRENFLHDMFPEKLMFSSFLDIRDSHFDVDCRKFLNKFNMKDDLPNKRIFSFPVENVKLDGEQLYKPDDEGYDNFWIDFNSGSQRISLFCQSTLLPSQLSQSKETRWETLSLRADDVKKYNCDAKHKFWVVRVELKVNAQMLTNRGREKKPHLFVCHLSNVYDVQTALTATFKEGKQKASVPQNLLILPSKDPSPSFSRENPVEIPLKQPEILIPDSKSNPDIANSLHDNTGQKSSVPLELMSIVTSSLSSTDGSRYISWETLANRNKKKRSNTQCSDPGSKLKFDSSCKSRPICEPKNSIKCSVPNRRTGRLSNNLLSKDTELTGQSGVEKNDDNDVPHVQQNSDHLSKADIGKAKNPGKQKITAFNTNVSQSPVTASGDYVCHDNKSEKNNSVDKKSTIKEKTSKALDRAVNISVMTECKTSHNPLKNTRRDVRVDDLLSKEGGKCVRKSTCQAKETMTVHNGQQTNETPSRTRKSGMRSVTKRTLTPVVSFEPDTPKVKSRSNLRRENSKEPDKFLANDVGIDLPLREVSAREKNSLQVAKVMNKEIGIESKEHLCNKPKDKEQSSGVTTLNENVNRNESFDDFKSPKAFNKIKRHDRGQKKNRKMQEVKTGFEVEKELNLSIGGTLNDSLLNHQSAFSLKKNKEYQVDSPQNAKFSKTEQERAKVVSEYDLSKLKLKTNYAQESGHSDNKSMDSDVVCSESGELYVEIDKNVAKTKTGEIQEYVCETQIDNNNESINVDGETDDNYIQSSNLLKMSHGDTQASSAVIGSYVFNTKNDDKMEKVDICLENYEQQDCPALEEKKAKMDLDKKYVQRDRNMDGTFQTSKNQTKCYKEKSVIANSSPPVTSSNNILIKGLDNLNGKSSSSNQLKCKKNLRPRNRDICYTECDSGIQSNSTTDEKDKTILSKKSDKREKKMRDTPMEDFLFSSMNCENNEAGVHSSGGVKFKNEKHEESFKIARNLNNYTIWRSQEIKTTVTTMPINGGSDCDLSDPYNFDSECLVRLKESKTFPPYTSNSFQTSNDYLDITHKPSQKDKHCKSKKLTESTHHVQHQLSKLFKDTNSADHACFEKPWKSNKKKDKNYTPMEKKPKGSFIQSKALNTSDGCTPTKRVKKYDSIPSKRNDSPEILDGGLVFPPLDDSIPCTPGSNFGDNIGHESAYSLESKSFGTQLSWIAKVKTSPKRRKQMRGKTYGHKNQNNALPEPQICGKIAQNVSQVGNKSHVRHEEDRLSDDGSESDSKFKRLDSVKRSDSKGTRKNDMRKMYNTFDLSSNTTGSLSGNPATMRKGAKGKEKAKISSTLPAKNKTLKSSFNEKQKTTKRKLSFEEKGKEERRIRSCQYLENETMQSPRYSFSFSKASWDQLSTKNDNKCKSVIDNTERKNLTKDKDSISFKGNGSGPSSTCRLNRSALKRKYPSVSSAAETEFSCSDSPPKDTSYRSPRLIPKNLFDPETTLSTRSKKKNKSKDRSFHKESEQVLNDSLSSDEENYNPSNIYDFSFVSSNKETVDKPNLKSKQTCEIQKTMKKVISTPLKRKSILKSPMAPDKVLDKSSLHLSSSPEIARDCVKRTHKTPRNKSLSLDLGMTLRSPLLNNSLNSPFTLSPLQSPQIPTTVSNHKKRPGSYYSHGNIHDLFNMYSDAKEKEVNNEDYGGPYKSLHHLIQMGKMNSIVQSEASSSWTDTPDILRSINHILKASLTKGQGKRSKAIKEFDQCLQSLMYKTEKLWKDSKETERKATLLWSQQMQRVQAFREFSNQSLESLKYACNDLVNEIKETQTTEDKVKKSVKSAVKKDFDALTNNIKTRYNEHSLEAMKRCLQVSFMLT